MYTGLVCPDGFDELLELLIGLTGLVELLGVVELVGLVVLVGFTGLTGAGVMHSLPFQTSPVLQTMQVTPSK